MRNCLTPSLAYHSSDRLVISRWKVPVNNLTLALEREAMDKLTTTSDTFVRKVARFSTHHFTHNPLSSINRSIWTSTMHPISFLYWALYWIFSKIISKIIQNIFLVNRKVLSKSSLELVVWSGSTTSCIHFILGDKCCNSWHYCWAIVTFHLSRIFFFFFFFFSFFLYFPWGSYTINISIYYCV